MKKGILVISSLIAYACTYAADISPSLRNKKQEAQLSETTMLALGMDIALFEPASQLRKYIQRLGVDKARQLLTLANQHQQKNIVTSCAKMLATHLHAIKDFDTLPDHLQKAVLVPHVNTTLRKLYGAQQQGTEFTLEADDVVWLAEYNNEHILARTKHKVWQKNSGQEEGFKIVYTSPDTPIISARTTKHPDKLLIGTQKNIFEYDMATSDQKVVYDSGDQDIQEVTGYNKEQNRLLLITGTGWYFNRETVILVDLLTNQSQHVYKAPLDITSVRPNKDWSKMVITSSALTSGSVINSVYIKDLKNDIAACVYSQKGFLAQAIASDEDMSKLLIISREAPKGVFVHDVPTDQNTDLTTPDYFIKTLQANPDGSEILLESLKHLMTYDVEGNKMQTAYSLPKYRYILWAGYGKNDNEVQVVSRSYASFCKLYFTSLLLSPFLPQLETMNLEQLRLLLKASACWKEQKPYTITTEKEFLLYQSLDEKFHNSKFFEANELVDSWSSCPIT